MCFFSSSNSARAESRKVDLRGAGSQAGDVLVERGLDVEVGQLQQLGVADVLLPQGPAQEHQVVRQGTGVQQVVRLGLGFLTA